MRLSHASSMFYRCEVCLKTPPFVLFYLFIYLFIVIWRPLGHVTRNYQTAVPHLAPLTPPCPWGGHCPNPIPPVVANLVRAPEGVRAFRLTSLYVRRLRSPLQDLAIVKGNTYSFRPLDPCNQVLPCVFSCYRVVIQDHSSFPVSHRSRSNTCWYLVCSNHSMRLGFCLSLSTHASSSPCFTAIFFLPLFFRGALSIQVRDKLGASTAPEGLMIHCQDQGTVQWRKCSWNLKRASHPQYTVMSWWNR
jgi:hypothetical protein